MHTKELLEISCIKDIASLPLVPYSEKLHLSCFYKNHRNPLSIWLWRDKHNYHCTINIKAMKVLKGKASFCRITILKGSAKDLSKLSRCIETNLDYFKDIVPTEPLKFYA